MGRFAKSRMAARLQMVVSERRLESGLYAEIAALLPIKDHISLLDVGTGTGLMLHAVHAINPSVELHGLDISSEAIRLAKTQLVGIPVNLHGGSIEKTQFSEGQFDIVTCNASMSYWENPVVCFNEIYRILRPGGSAVLIEPYAEIDVDKALDTIRENMRGKSTLRRWMAIKLNKLGLQKGNRLGMNLYHMDEVEDLIRQSVFSGFGDVSETSLQRLPIFMKISLRKPEK